MITKFIKPTWIKLAATSLGLILTGCSMTEQPTAGPAVVETAPAEREFHLIAINDIYNIEGIDGRKSGGMARLRTLRDHMTTSDGQPLLLHAGDFLFPSSMSSQFKGRQMIDVMNSLDGAQTEFDERFFVVFGNHEFDKGRMKDGPMLSDRINESGFYWLGTNIDFHAVVQSDKPSFQKALINNKIITINGIKVGIFGLTTNISIPEYAKIDENYVEIARQQVADLRARGAEVVLAVTHLKMSEDVDLLEQLGDAGPDAIFGGHEHNRQANCAKGRCVVKADADLRSAAVAKVKVAADGKVSVDHHFVVLNDTTIASDVAVERQTNQWLSLYQNQYCSSNKLPRGCLTEVFGKTDVELIGEELEIRRFETNLGAYVADQMIRAFDNVELPGGRKVQAALINAGSLRLNQNIPAQAELNQWYLNGIFQYPVDLRVLEVSGKVLKQMIYHTIEDWTGNGWWLHVSGMAYRHDAKNGKATDISLLDAEGNATLVKDDDVLTIVVNNYMADPNIANQDGYTMLNLDQDVPYGDLIDLKSVVIDAIKAEHAEGRGIAPKLPGRVCNNTRPQLFCILDK